MKIRSGFVSNSSSSSFCILGVEVDAETYDKVSAVRYDKRTPNTLDSHSGISCEDQYVIGYYPSKMKDDETLAQFKKRIVDEAFDTFQIIIDPKSIDWYIDGGYDG